MDNEVELLLRQHNDCFKPVAGKSKIECTLNGHTFPANVGAFEAFLRGAKFKKLKRAFDAENELDALQPYILRSKNLEDKFYCALTCRLMEKDLETIKKHMEGKRFLKAKERFEQGKHSLMEEPELDTEERSESTCGDMEERMAELEAMEIQAEPNNAVQVSDGTISKKTGNKPTGGKKGGNASKLSNTDSKQRTTKKKSRAKGQLKKQQIGTRDTQTPAKSDTVESRKRTGPEQQPGAKRQKS